MSALAVWDFTLSVDKSTNDHTMIIDELEKIAKKWTFQREKPYEYDEDGNVINLDTLDTTDDDSDIDDDNDDDFVDDFSSSESSSESDISDFDLDDIDSYDSDSSDNSELSNDSQQGSFEHWQGRISLIKKKRKTELLNLLYENDFLLANAHWRPTTNICMGDIFYVVKIDSRIDGPWDNRMAKPIPIPKQIKMITELYPYQQEIIDRAMYCWNVRNINVLYDPDGCKGKSTLATYCGCHQIGRKIPCLNNYLDIMQCIMSMPISKLYFIDMPRAINKYKLVEFYAGIEDIKNGFCFDTRYKYTEMYFDTPEIWIFTNKLPDVHLLSADRWVIWTLKDNELFLWSATGDLKKGPEIVYPEPESENEGGTLTDNSFELDSENEEMNDLEGGSTQFDMELVEGGTLENVPTSEVSEVSEETLLKS